MDSNNIEILLSIIIKSFDETEPCYQNRYFYGYTTDDRTKINAGIDENMYKFILEHISMEFYKKFNWKILDNGRTEIEIK